MSSGQVDVWKIETAPGLVFNASVGGTPDKPLVLMLHGFGVSRHFWHRQVEAMAGAGYFAVAPNQRGYSPGARPSDVDAYAMTECVADILALLDELEAPVVDVVGHDWGSIVAWHLAAEHPDRE